MKLNFINSITDFGKGAIAGFVIAAVIFGLVLALVYNRLKAKEVIEYVERQQVIEELREDYGNRDPVEFIETLPDVRGAADGATAEFERRRDEALERFRERLYGGTGFID